MRTTVRALRAGPAAVAARRQVEGRLELSRYRSITVGMGVVVLALMHGGSLAFAASAGQTRHGKYPMPAADYQHKVEMRVQQARERMETKIVRRKPTPEKARDVRGRFEAGVSEVRKVMADASSDGVITREEAQRVNQTTRELSRAAAHIPRGPRPARPATSGAPAGAK